MSKRNIERKFLTSVGQLAAVSLETGPEWVSVALSDGYDAHFEVTAWVGSYICSSRGDDMEATLKDMDTLIDFFTQARANTLLIKKNLPTKEEYEAKREKGEIDD